MVSEGLHFTAAHYFLKIIVDRLSANQINLSNSLLFAALSSFFFLSHYLFSTLFRKFETRIILPEQMHMRNELFYYITGHPLEFFMDNFAGNLSGRIADIVSGIRDIIPGVAEIFSSVFMFTLFASLFFRKSLLVPIILFSWTSICSVLSAIIIRMVSKAAREKSEKEGKYSGSVVDCFTSIYNVKSFSMESQESEKRRLESSDILKADIRLS
jgi:ATP-binding cassette subfamily B protein